jgi:beta-mannosidase
MRHAFKAWDGSPDSWLELTTIRDYFGESKDLDELVSTGQLLQAEGLKFIFEEARRQKPVCGMALNWCFNEPWPTAANGSLVSWPAEAKPALAAVRRACRPVLVSARASKFTWEEGETFTAELFLLNDSPEPVPEGHVEAAIVVGDEMFYLLGWDILGAKANTNVRGPVVHFYLPALKTDRFRLVLKTDPATEWESSYTFLYQAGSSSDSLRK